MNASFRRDLVEEIFYKSHRWLEDYVADHDGPISDDVLLLRNGVEEILEFFDDRELDKELYRQTELEIEEIIDNLKAARDYPKQVRRDWARTVGL